MKNQLQRDKIKAHTSPEKLAEHRATLMIDCMTYANEANNGERSPDMALKCITGRRDQYRDYYDSLARQAHSIGMADEAANFREVSKLFTPWKCDELVADRIEFDKLIAEVELLELGSTSQDVIYYLHGEGEAE